MIYLPLFAAFIGAIGTIWEKIIVRKRKIDTKVYLTAGFLAIVLAMLPFMFFFWDIKEGAFALTNLFIFFMIIVFSIIANLFVLYSLKWEKISNLEPLRMIEPLLTILLAIIFSYFIDGNLYERNIKVIIPALIAGTAIIFAHFEKHHLKFNKYLIAAILGSLFFALELVMTRMMLEFYSPMTFYFIRCLAIFLISLVIFRPKMGTLQTPIKLQILVIAVMWVVYRVIIYYGYMNLGIIFTTLMVMLSPVFIYLLAWKFLKDKITWRNIVASIIIVGCIIYVVGN